MSANEVVVSGQFRAAAAQSAASAIPGLREASNQGLETATADTLVSPIEAASHIKVAPGTLAVWRSTKRYPLPYVKVGRKVQYRLGDLNRFLESRTVGAEAA